MRRLFEGGAYSSNYCNWQLESLLHLGQIVITFRTLLHLGPFITFRPSTYNRLGEYNQAKELHEKVLMIRKQIFGEDHKYAERIRSELALVNKQLLSSRAEDRHEKARCLIL